MSVLFFPTEGGVFPSFYFATKLIEIDLAYWSSNTDPNDKNRSLRPWHRAART
jgi:hypothetical protein